MLLLKDVSFSVLNILGTQSSGLQINFGVLQIYTENSATGVDYRKKNIRELNKKGT